MSSLRAAQEQWDGRTPMDDEAPEEHEYTGDIWLHDEIKVEFYNGSIEAIIIIDPDRHVKGFNLGSLIDSAHEKAMEAWLEELAAYADDEDGY